MIGYALTGSYCTHSCSIEALKRLRDSGADIIPIVSENVFSTDTRFGKAAETVEKIEKICERSCVHTITEAEKFGPAQPLDALIISPCTGNTLAKLASGITDTAVTMSAKAHLRCNRPLLIALASNDAMAANLGNIGTLLNRKNIYFVPMRQDEPLKKPHSLVADFESLSEAYEKMLSGMQMRPLFL
ncbi:MAG: dipicolinate synthase subunit B [Candidatus Avispirillum sp.]